jgi:aldehyde dehydrogenase (NAD+)
MKQKDLDQFSIELTHTYNQLRHGLIKKERDYNWRIEQLTSLKRLLLENNEALNQAMWKDLHKSEFECESTEQGVVLAEINVTLKNLRKWMKPKKVCTPIYNQPGRSHIVHQPYGLALIIGAWNYPINLTLAPLVGAIAGGNGAIIKPSEISAHTAILLGELIPKYLDKDLFAVIQGAAEETDLLLDKKFDLVFFTGSSHVGKIILSKTAPQLTPTILELGGKSPAIVMKDADLPVTARRLVWGKFMNAGQTCVAPDYILAPPEIIEDLIAELKKVLLEFFGTSVIKNSDYCRIVNQKNFDRIVKLTEGLSIRHGGDFDRDQLFISPTIAIANHESAIMQEEIFGPILPILEFKELSGMIGYISENPKPLALYLFTKNSDVIEEVIHSTFSGGLCINDTIMHMPMPELPFGGVGASGMGSYHGEFSFKTFTHAKGVLRKSFWFDVPIRYPPYTKRKAWWLRRLFS